MRNLVVQASPGQARAIYLAPIIVAFAMSVFPPLYLSVSGSRGIVLGLPVSVLYMVVAGTLVSVGVALAYWVETVRGEVGD